MAKIKIVIEISFAVSKQNIANKFSRRRISALGEKKQTNNTLQNSDNGIISWQLVKSALAVVAKPSLTSIFHSILEVLRSRG